MQHAKIVLAPEQNQDVQSDLYEYMLGHMQFAGRGGQFRTPRHIVRMMVQEEFAGMVACVESLPLASLGDFVRGRMGESARQVEGLFESLLAEAFE